MMQTAMKQVGGWWLPAAERHLVPFLRRDRGYQARHRAAALAQVKDWRVAVDCGSHVGLWSRDLAARFDKVIAFEPMAPHRDCFLRNVSASNVDLRPVALGETAGTVAIDWDGENTGHARVAEGKAGNVPVQALDEFELPVCDLLKADCEGFEVKVMRGARETLLRCRPVVCVEQKRWVYQGEHQYSALEYLTSLGMVQLDRVSDDVVMGWPA